MRSPLTPNSYLEQIRYRLQRRQEQFLGVVDGHASQAGATGQTGAAIKRTLESLRVEFDATIDEQLRYLGQTIAQSPQFEGEAYQLTARSLEEAANAFKAIVNSDRLKRLARGMDARIDRLAQEGFDGVDELVRLRLSEFRTGLHGASPLPASVPAANRYVPITHNQQIEVADDLTVLKEAIRGSNEADEEEREIARYEIAIFEATLVQPRAATDLIQRFVDMLLGWIRRTFTAAAVQEVAQRLIQALLRLIA